MIAEDSELNYEMLADCLSVGRHDVSWARDGQEAVASLEVHEFDLMLLDLHMPRFDGLSVLRWLRETSTRGMKVIVLTADSRREMRETALSLGADAFPSKPLDLQELSTAIKAVTGMAAGCGRPPEETQP